MTYPQPQSDDAVNAALSFFRINTPLLGGGDCYESQAGATAFALGPESDVANVEISYLDDTQKPSLMNSFVISPQRALIASVLAANDRSYQPSGVPGRIIMRPLDLWNPTGDWSSFFDLASPVFVPPQFDVIQYLTSPPPSVTPARRDKTWRYNQFAGVDAEIAYVFPFYGRRGGQWTFLNTQSVASVVKFGVLAFNYKVDITASLRQYLVGPPLVDPAVVTVANGAQNTGIIKASSLNQIDAIAFWFNFQGGSRNGFDFRFTISDQEF